jgi:hypothetical protein
MFAWIDGVIVNEHHIVLLIKRQNNGSVQDITFHISPGLKLKLKHFQRSLYFPLVVFLENIIPKKIIYP